MTALLTLEAAQARLLALATLLPVERVDAESALGRFLAEPLLARRTQPACDLSAMDGYAVAGDDLTGPWRVIGESAAGHPYVGTVGPGEAVRIATGAVLPAGAQAVIVQEDLARNVDSLRLIGTAPHPADKHIRRAGLDFVNGDALVPTGARFGPAHIALALAAGHPHVAVRRLPRVVVIDSGDELAADCERCAPHQVPASNGVMLAALLTSSVPCQVQRIGPVPDDLAALAGALDDASDADLVITSGGASVGDHDLIRPALERASAELQFWRVAIKPGKPLLIARRGHQVIAGLPGNPVASHVTAFHFVLPLLRAMLGAHDCLPRCVPARLAAPLAACGGRREFLRAQWDGNSVTTQAVQDSSALASLAASNVLIDRAAHAPPAATGDEVQIYLLGNGGII
ncbi:MAG: molybdopterin molybdotransferase MoeA [Sphingomonadales bacterium]|nr:molybdopterin molybdotransferase MoeA [Sphingomonadales bacterium]